MNKRFVENLISLISTNTQENGEKCCDVAEKIGLSRSMISKYINSVGMPDVESLVKIADYYKVSTDWLLGRCGRKNEDDSLEYESLPTCRQVRIINARKAQDNARMARNSSERINAVYKSIESASLNGEYGVGIRFLSGCFKPMKMEDICKSLCANGYRYVVYENDPNYIRIEWD